jgi:hypothetical protein
VLARIASACARAGRDPSSVELVAVTKGVDVARIRDAVDVGLTLLGENRVQEAEAKVGAVRGAHWHLVGHLQSNKAARALAVFEAIESVDSLALARRLDRLASSSAPGASRPGIYLQVNVDADPDKEGFTPVGIARDLDEVLALLSLEVRGLMTVGQLVADPEAARPTFVRLRDLSERLRAGRPRLGAGLSMGMSDDFEIAIEEGSTLVRIGRALFGERPRA